MRQKDKQQCWSPQISAAHITRREFVRDGALLLGSLSALPLLGRAGFELTAPTSAESQDPPSAQIQGSKISLANSAVAAEWQVSSSGLQFVQIQDRRNRQTIAGPASVFSLTLAGGSQIASSAMTLLEAPQLEDLAPEPHASRFSERISGRAVTASFEDSQHGLRADWRAILRDGSHYIRQEVEFSAAKESLPITEVNLFDLRVPDAAAVGSVKGSPVVSGAWFLGFEHPLSQSAVEGGRVRCSLRRQLPLEHGRSAAYSSVIGATAPGQLRRDFLRYVERERAHPYRTFLHYNSWYDLGYFTPYNEAGALDVIRAFGEELRVKRGVVLDSFLFDDGWDNHKSLWDFNSGFPNGFTPLKNAAAKYDAAPGIWLSPWGGYDGPQKERLAYGKRHGYEENSGGFVLSGPRYFRHFREVCLEMIRTYRINQFKFDGTGNASTVFPGSEFDSDFAAMISLIGDLRAAEPDLYVNLTTGTYPSPFWLRYADSIWRGGDDNSFAGVGSNRQRWITYRDADTYEHVVRRGPLYPLNSLMLHGMIYARYAEKLADDPGHDFPAEIHSYFGTGTQLQEMYVTHSLLSDADWNTLAEAARWSRRNADTLVDTRWIGGDPARLEVYGWASWSPRRGIVTLRNPDKVPHRFGLDPQLAFELPPGATQNYAARSPWAGASTREVTLHANKPYSFTLQPFEVLTLEAAPR
jgi:hypothetical protein